MKLIGEAYVVNSGGRACLPRPGGTSAAVPGRPLRLAWADLAWPGTRDARWLASGRLPPAASPVAGAGRAAPATAYGISPGRVPARRDEHRDAVEHMGQACFEFLFPAVLGEPGRQAVHRRETPGVDLVRGVEQLARLAAARTASRCPGERAGLRPPGTGSADPLPSPEAVSVPVKDPSPGLGSRSVTALVSSSRWPSRKPLNVRYVKSTCSSLNPSPSSPVSIASTQRSDRIGGIIHGAAGDRVATSGKACGCARA